MRNFVSCKMTRYIKIKNVNNKNKFCFMQQDPDML